jgi:hypothetical protein
MLAVMMLTLRALALSIAASAALLPATARGAAALHVETLPSGVHTAADMEDARTAVLDSSGDLLVDMYTSGKGRWAVRPPAGPLGVSQGFPQPSIIGDWPSPAMMSLDSAGNAIAYSGAFWTYRLAGAASVWGPVTQATGNDRLIDVAMAPTGEALGAFKNGDTIKLAFRPAGAGAAFDLDNATTINPSPGDTSTTPVALTIDPDGDADLLYRSEHTGSRIYLETRRPAGGAFQTPVQYDWPQTASLRFSRAPDGTAAISGWTGYNTAFAAVRPPGGTFAARQTIETAPPDGELGLYQPVLALNGGRAVTAVTHSHIYNQCTGGAGSTSGWTLHGYDPQLGWTTLSSGADTWPQLSSVVGMAGSGTTVAFVTSELSGVGDRCANTFARSLTLHTGTLAGGLQTFTLGTSEGDANRVPNLTFVAAGPQGVTAAGFTFLGGATPDPLERIAVYEDATAPAGDGDGGGDGTPAGDGTSTGAGTNPGVAGTLTPSPAAGTVPTLPAKRPIAPPKVTLTGPIGIRENVAPLPFSCPPEEPGTCLLAIRLLGVRPHASASTAAKAKTIVLGKATASVKPGKRKIINIQLSRAGRTFVKPHRTAAATLTVVVTIGQTKTTITKHVKLRRR